MAAGNPDGNPKGETASETPRGKAELSVISYQSSVISRTAEN
jgi:hypothetical protein